MTPTPATTARPDLPELPLDAWEPTKTTLHLWAQIVGKVKLAATAPRNHWWNVPLYLDVRGLTTRRLHHGQVSFQIDLDLVDHRLVARTNRGQQGSFRLHDGLSVAGFDRQLHRLLDQLGVDVPIREDPYGVPMTTPFPNDTEHAAYDPEYVRRFWQVLDWVDTVLEEFSGWYCGKQSPVHLLWHSFDLAVTRFSGRRAPPRDGADPVTREAYSHELISFGFWAGDHNTREPAFYSYTAPEPPGLPDQPLQPAAATWHQAPQRVDGAARLRPGPRRPRPQEHPAGTVALSDHPVLLPPPGRSNTADCSHDRRVQVILGTLARGTASTRLGFAAVFRLNATVPATVTLRWVEPGQPPRPRQLDLVFRTERGTALNPNHASRGFATLARGVGLDAHPHMLRHALASAMAANKEPASIIAAQLRHADGGALAQRVYIHQLPQTAPRVAGLIEGVLGPAARDARSASAPRRAERNRSESRPGSPA